jgi:hypothetical protein
MTLGTNGGLSIGTPAPAPAQGLLVVGAATFSSSVTATALTLTSTDSVIATNTSDGLDNKSINISGGGTQSIARGANLRLYGNEYTGEVGNAYLFSGNVANSNIVLNAYSASSTIQFLTNNVERMQIASNGNLILSSTTTGGGTKTTFNVIENGGVVIDSSEGATPRYIEFATGGTPKMFIAAAGNVGIGTTSPAYSLDVSGRIRAFTASSGVSPRTDLGGTIIAEGSTRAGLYILTTGTAAGSYGSIWWGNGNTNTDGSITVQNDTRSMDFGTADGLRMRITASGRVLIGTPPPAESTFTLDVNGTGRFSGSVRAAGAFFTAATETVGSIRTTFASDNSYFSLFSNDGALTLDTYGVGAFMNFKILGTTRLTIANNGQATFSLGIEAKKALFGVSGVATPSLIVNDNDQSNVRLRLQNSTSGNTWDLVGGLNAANNSDFSVYDVTNNVTALRIVPVTGAATFSSSVTANGTLSLQASATGSTATHVPVFTADPASTTRSLLTRTLQDFKFDVGSFIAKGVRSNAGDYTRTLDSVNDYSLWQDNFSWLSSYYATKIIIEAQTTGNITSTNVADKQLTIGWGISTDTDFNGESYCTVNVPLGVGTVDFNVIITGTITITSTSELKMVIQVQIASGNVITQNVMRMANITAAGAMLNAAKNIAFIGKMNVTGTHTWSQRQTYLRLN